VLPPDIVFYDGTCALCHQALRLILRNDPGGLFRFAPLGGETAAARLPDPATLPDSIVLLTSSGDLLTGSDAVIRILRRLGGGWRILAAVIGVAPRPLRDGVYNVVARTRYRVFGREETACPAVTPELQTRFLR
jgi:predicted DCC family thiol-disulfide oxidoreductase YuxK